MQRYADSFGITPRIRFSTRVISIQKSDLKNPDLTWQIEIETENKRREVCQFDLVVVASGMYSQAYVPTIKGQEKFAGRIAHASSIKSGDEVMNKRVAIIGGGKTATDMAVLAGKYGQSCYLVFRHAYWMLPRTLCGGYLPMGFMFSRLWTFPCDLVPGAPYTKLSQFLHRRFPELFTKILDSVGATILATHGPDLFGDQIFVPQHSFKNIESVSVISKDFIPLKKAGRIIGQLAGIEEIVDATTIRLSNGEEIQADMIICATGYTEHCAFFSQQTAEALGLRTNEATGKMEFNLYRRIVPVGVPNIAFVGFTVSAAYWMVAEAASHWISDYFLGRLKLPDSEDRMHEEIMVTQAFIRRQFNRTVNYFHYYWLAPIEIYLKDMGVSLYRTSNWITEYFTVYRPARFRGLHEERRAIAQGRPLQRIYCSFIHTIIMLVFLCFLSIWLYHTF